VQKNGGLNSRKALLCTTGMGCQNVTALRKEKRREESDLTPKKSLQREKSVILM
jgi:hypothetical protein